MSGLQCLRWDRRRPHGHALLNLALKSGILMRLLLRWQPTLRAELLVRLAMLPHCLQGLGGFQSSAVCHHISKPAVSLVTIDRISVHEWMFREGWAASKIVAQGELRS